MRQVQCPLPPAVVQVRGGPSGSDRLSRTGTRLGMPASLRSTGPWLHRLGRESDHSGVVLQWSFVPLVTHELPTRQQSMLIRGSNASGVLGCSPCWHRPANASHRAAADPNISPSIPRRRSGPARCRSCVCIFTRTRRAGNPYWKTSLCQCPPSRSASSSVWSRPVMMQSWGLVGLSRWRGLPVSWHTVEE